MMRNRSGTRWAAQLPRPKFEVVTLSALGPGERGVVAELFGGRGLLGRMTALGFTPGAEVAIVQNFGHGPLIALIRGARVALGRGAASKIRVRRISRD